VPNLPLPTDKVSILLGTERPKTNTNKLLVAQKRMAEVSEGREWFGEETSAMNDNRARS
jgi:hypothetical protein